MPAVTVAIPTSRAAYISRAIESVLGQTFQDFEIVVVNDGASDTASLERVLDPFRSRIEYVYQANAGIAAARNAAVAAAHAPLILNLDDDDWLEPVCIEKQVSFMRENPDLDARYANPIYFGETDWSGTCWMDHFPSEGEVSFLSVLEGRTAPANPGAILRRDTVLAAGPYDSWVDSWEDFDMWLRILRGGGRVAYTREALVHYRRHGGNVSARGIYHLERGLRVLDKLESSTKLTVEEAAQVDRRRGALRYDLELLRGKEALARREWVAAREHFEYCVRAKPTAKLRLIEAALRISPGAVGAGMTWREGILRWSGRQRH